MLLNPETQELACQMFKGLTDDEKKDSIMYAVSTLFESVFYTKCEVCEYSIYAYNDEFYFQPPFNSILFKIDDNSNIDEITIELPDKKFNYTLYSWERFCGIVYSCLCHKAAIYSKNILWENRKGGLVYGGVK